MMDIFAGFTYGFLIIGWIFVALFFVFSIIEKERKATIRSLVILFGLTSISSILFLSATPSVVYAVCTIVLAILILGSILKFLNPIYSPQYASIKYDERDIMFARNELVPRTKRYDDYYSLNPEKKQSDDNFRNLPGLLKKGSKLYNHLLFNASKATFKTVKTLNSLVENESVNSENKQEVNPEEVTNFIKNWSRKLGVHSVGITQLEPHHLYSIGGRGDRYGKEVKLNHQYAIAFTVEMDHGFMGHAPYGPVAMESAQQYLNSGTIAVQIAEFIRNLGFEARAHIDGNYKLVCPLVAMDAGLGTIGRMGLLMTPKLGTRVRIGVVTTNLKLVQTKQNSIYSMIEFCKICKKCADVCPSDSIPHSEFNAANGLNHWKINSESCFTYWNKIGTDCGRCMQSCPYSHPNNFIHNLVRWYISRNPINRWIALKMDDFFYGRKPKPKILERWMRPHLN